MNPTSIIKSKFSNQVHKLLEPNIGMKRSERWKKVNVKKYTDAEKVALFDQIDQLHKDTSAELTNYQFNRRMKKRIHAARVKRGYNFKKKMSKEDYLKTQLQHA